ncbi:MAG TPA: hypothetical protein VN326_08745 [Casimicrobiaceae bacterium]|nr:hypothetical protein [Casimicrobiaceae bacterium]
MTSIIAGRFEQQGQAESAVAALRRGGFNADDVTVFFVNPPGPHAIDPIGGILVAVRALEFARRVAAVNVLRAQGAQDIERADGTWQAGRWIDFDPLKPPLLVDLPAPEDVQLRK